MKAEKQRDEWQRMAEDARARGDSRAEKHFAQLVWASAKAERDQQTNEGTK